MKRIQPLFLSIVLLLGCFVGHTQENKTYNLNTVNFRPTIGVGIGMLNYYGDISRSNRTDNPLISDIGYDFRVSFPLYKGFDIHFYSILGSLSANEIGVTRSLNFRSSIFVGGAAAAYNFEHFLDAKKTATPFLLLGVESVSFNSKADLHDEFGNTYHYWTDGTIRNLPEAVENEFISTRLQRDYIYETDIRKQNLDGFGDYSQNSIAIPVGAGVNLHINEKIDLRLGGYMHFMLTDYLDGITKNSVGARQGNSGLDKFLYSAVSISYDLTGEDSYLGLSKKDLKALDLGDEDDDGIIDFKDECPHTPAGAPVDHKGCPLDSDKDGVPDYKDLEKDTPEGNTVDSLGQTMTDEQIQNEFNNFLNGTDSSKQGYSDTSFAIELTDKTQRNTGILTPSGGVLVQPSGSGGTSSTTGNTSGSSSGGTPSSSTKPIEGFSVNPPKAYPGVVYRVQVMATKSMPKINPFPSMTDLSAGQFPDGYYRFFNGEFNNKNAAQAKRNQLKSSGIDGFVRIFEDGVLLPMGQKPRGAPANLSGGSNQGTSNSDNEGADKSTGSAKGNETKEDTPTPAPAPKPKTVVPEGDFELPETMNQANFKFRVLLESFSGKASADAIAKYEEYGPVDVISQNGSDKLYMGEFPTLDMAKRFEKELRSEGLSNLSINGEYQGKMLSQEEFNQMFK